MLNLLICKAFNIVNWLASQDSNLGQRSQSPLCYHYTTRQCYT